MRKLLLLSLFFLSGCVSDTTVYKHYSVAASQEKASLFVEKPEYYRDEWEWKHRMSMSPAFQETFRKYFVKSDERNADFILRQTYYKDDTSGGTMTWAFFSGFTLGVIPMWGEGKVILSYSLTDTKKQETIQLSDIPTKGRFFFGWLMMPAILFPGVHFLDDDVEGRAFASAMEEAASLIYNPNSRLYRQEKKRSAPDTPVKKKTTERLQRKVPLPASEPASSTNAMSDAAPVAPAKTPSPEEMDLLW